MRNILALNGSPRPLGNTSHLLQQFLDGAGINSDRIEVINSHEVNIKHCNGCLRCNVLKRCSVTGDDWEDLSKKILAADVLVFATPIYFLHLPGPLKTIIDRFRSFNHVQITEKGLIHTPWQEWKKDFVLILCMGSPDDKHADPVIDMFRYMTSALGAKNSLHIIKATRLAVSKQVIKSEEELKDLYSKLDLPISLAGVDFSRNERILKECHNLGIRLSKS